MLDRRAFLGQGTRACVALTAASIWPARPPASMASADSRAGRSPGLVPVFLRGGADGLGLVVPFGDAEYYRLRPRIAVSPPGRTDGALDLDGFFGLHPRMAPLVPWWRRGHLAIVHACGLPAAPASHFAAQDAMLDAVTRLSLHARVGDRTRALGLHGGGWDSHARQGGASGALAEQAGRLAHELDALARALGDRLADLTVIVTTEFGRTVAENAEGGTDHGHGHAVLVLGGRVRGGRVYGRWPGLDAARRGGLDVTTDIRDVMSLTTT